MTEKLFVKQADSYAKGRPSYPDSLFEKLAALTLQHDLAWDVGTGNGQSAVKKIHSMISIVTEYSNCWHGVPVAEHYKSVIATDVSEPQLSNATRKENVKYSLMSATPSLEELELIVGAEGSVDLVTVATALHWFDLDKFYALVKRVLRKPGGVFVAWTYTRPRISPEIDNLMENFHEMLKTYHSEERRWLVDEYRTIPFPFEPVLRHERGAAAVPGRVEVETLEMEMPIMMDTFLNMLKSASTVQRALDNGLDILNEDAREKILKIWGSPDRILTARFPLFLLIGTVSERASAN